MATSTSQFLGPTALVGAVTLGFTVPAGRIYLVRLVRIANRDGTNTGGGRWGIGGTGANQRVGSFTGIAADSMASDTSWWAMTAGQAFYSNRTGTSTQLEISVYGYDLAG